VGDNLQGEEEMASKAGSKPATISRDAKTGRFISKEEAKRLSTTAKASGKKTKKK
jgi:hypothetical protein